MRDFKAFIDVWKERYEHSNREFHFKEFCNKKGLHTNPIDKKNQSEFCRYFDDILTERKKEYEKKYHFDNFDDYLNVYDLRCDGVSWSKITKQLNLNSIQTARNHFKAACELIEKGVDLYVT